MSYRVALRSGADGSSLLEAFLGALVVGDSARRHQVGLQESLSGLLRSPTLVEDGVLLMNCVLQVHVADAAFAPLASGPRDSWRTLKRGGDPLPLLASVVEEACQKINSCTVENIYKSKALRGELYDKFIQILTDDEVPERRHYARELANYAREMLSSRARRAAPRARRVAPRAERRASRNLALSWRSESMAYSVTSDVTAADKPCGSAAPPL